MTHRPALCVSCMGQAEMVAVCCGESLSALLIRPVIQSEFSRAAPQRVALTRRRIVGVRFVTQPLAIPQVGRKATQLGAGAQEH